MDGPRSAFLASHVREIHEANARSRPLLPILPEVTPWHGRGCAGSSPAAPHIPASNEVPSRTFLHTSAESPLHPLTLWARSSLRCLLKTYRKILPPECNLSEENSFTTWLNEFQGTEGFLSGRKNYSNHT